MEWACRECARTGPPLAALLIHLGQCEACVRKRLLLRTCGHQWLAVPSAGEKLQLVRDFLRDGFRLANGHAVAVPADFECPPRAALKKPYSDLVQEWTQHR
jgi:hypothetical protein